MNNSPIEVKINDVTLREGDQAPLTSFNKKEKQIIALMLAELGVACIEVGFGASRADADNIKSVRDLFGNNKTKYDARISSLGRAVSSDTDASLDVLSGYSHSRIHIFIATPDSHINLKFGSKGKDIEERRKWVLNQIKTEVEKAKNYKISENPDLEIEFSPEAASDNSINKDKILDFESDQFNYLIESLIVAVKSGATILNIPDTVGNLCSHESEYFFAKISNRLDFLKKEGYNFELSCHIHNDLALASANAISSVRGGATWIETTICGIGERAGNTTISDIIGMISEKGKSMMYGTKYEGRDVILKGINTKLIGPISRFMENILNLNKSLQTPFIGALSDKDGSGVHNASGEVYGGSKDKNRYGGAEVEEFFSPRGGANQILKMLENHGVLEDRKSDIIEKVTKIACRESEITKALYSSNIYSIYFKEKGDFKIENISISGHNVEINLNIFGEKIVLSGVGEGDNGVINATINAVNDYLGKKIVDVKDIKIVNKPSIHQAIETFYKELEYNKAEVSVDFRKNIDELLREDNFGDNSRQTGIIHIKLDVDGNERNTVSSGNNVDEEMVKAIIYGSLQLFVEKILHENS